MVDNAGLLLLWVAGPQQETPVQERLGADLLAWMDEAWMIRVEGTIRVQNATEVVSWESTATADSQSEPAQSSKRSSGCGGDPHATYVHFVHAPM
jgi:hypothetical protein